LLQKRQEQDHRDALADPNERGPGNEHRETPAEAFHEVAEQETMRVHTIKSKLHNPARPLASAVRSIFRNRELREIFECAKPCSDACKCKVENWRI